MTATLGDAIRRPHARYSTVTHRNLVTGTTTVLPIKDGSVTEDAGAENRWSLDLTIAPFTADGTDLFGVLDTPGGEITVSTTLRFPDGGTSTSALGVYIVDASTFDYSPGGDLRVTAPDRSLKVQRNKLAPDKRTSVASNQAWQEVKRLVEGAWPGSTYPFPGWSQLDTTATTKVGAQVWEDGDRWAAIKAICDANSVQFFFDDTGLAVLRPIPVLTSTSPYVWTVDANEDGVMIAADRTRDLSRVHNVVIMSTSATDVTFTPQVAANTTPGDPLNITGPLGYVPVEVALPTLRNSTQALAAAKTRLRQELGVAKTLDLEAVAKPDLRAEQVILAKLPDVDRNTTRPTELHILDSITHPLTPGGTQSMATRSTRPDSET